MRLQLALNVDNLDEAVDYYSKMFGTNPAFTKPGYANFAIEQPPLKLVLFERGGENGSINHLGVEVDNTQDVIDAQQRVQQQGLDSTDVADVACCFATKTEIWLDAPDGNRWEWYVRTGDADHIEHRDRPDSVDAGVAVDSCCQ